jgi:hypothetical protein
MTTMLEEYTTEEQRSLVRFFWAKVLNAKDIHKEVFPVYGGSVCRVKRFKTGSRNSLQRRSKIADDARPGRPVEDCDRSHCAAGGRVDSSRQEDNDSIATALQGVLTVLAYSIMHDHLKFRKMCARWVND